MPREREREVIADEVYASTTNPNLRTRRVISVFQGRVFYSTGGNKNRDCLLATMQQWIKRKKAEVINGK